MISCQTFVINTSANVALDSFVNKNVIYQYYVINVFIIDNYII
jgi:hypothetical protein